MQTSYFTSLFFLTLGTLFHSNLYSVYFSSNVSDYKHVHSLEIDTIYIHIKQKKNGKSLTQYIPLQLATFHDSSLVNIKAQEEWSNFLINSLKYMPVTTESGSILYIPQLPFI